MRTDSIASTLADTVYLDRLCEDSRELRETALQLRASSVELRLLSKVAVARAKASRASCARLTMPRPRIIGVATPVQTPLQQP